MTHPEVPPAPCGLVPRHSLGIRPCAVTSHMNQVNLNIKHLPVEYNLLQYKVAQVKRRLGDGSRSPKPPPPPPREVVQRPVVRSPRKVTVLAPG